MDLQSIIENYGYAAILIGTFLEGETILVLAGLAAHQGYLMLTGVIVAAFLGSLCGDQLFFIWDASTVRRCCPDVRPGGKKLKRFTNDEPVSNTHDPILSVSLRTAHSGALCHRNEPRIRQKVHFAKCYRRADLGGGRRIRRLPIRPRPGNNYRKDQAL